MGRMWRKKSSVGEGVVDRSSEVAGVVGGGLKLQNQLTHPKIAGSSDTHFSSSDKYLDWNYANRVGGSSIKQLLSYEMSTESEIKRRPPSIVARLMGFEGLSPLEHTNKHCPSNQVKSQLTNNESCSQMRPLKQQLQFKDVYEVSESTKSENQKYQSCRVATSDLSEAEMAFLRQRFIDAKGLATDESIQKSKEFNDALEVLHPNKDIFLRLLQEPESLSANRQHDFRRADPSPERSTIAKECVGNQSYINNYMSMRFPRDSLENINGGPTRKHSNSCSYSKKWLDISDDRYTSPTKIVVLKPNFRRVQFSESESDVLSCVSDFENSEKVLNTKICNTERQAKKHFSDGLQLPKQNTRESRELAKRITRKMRCGVRSNSLDFSVYGHRHQNGDGSSSCESENDSSYGSDYTSFKRHRTGRNKSVQFHDAGSSVSKEARKRLSERWKVTREFQEVGLSKRNTLGEMLSVPERRKESKIVILAGKGSTKGRRLYNSEEQASPIGISSREGWKYDQVNSLSRSTSVTAACNSSEVCKSPVRRKLSNDDKHLIQGISIYESRKSMKEISRRKKGLNGRRQRSKSDQLHSTMAQDHFCVSPHCDETIHGKGIIASEISIDAGLIINGIQGAKQSLAPSELYDHSRSVCLSDIHSPDGLSILNVQNFSDNKCEDSATYPNLHSEGLKSPSISKDGEQPSPMSVLGVSFIDDISSSTECFGSLTADLQGLRKQLQLLKQESLGYAESSVAISRSEDDESLGVSEKRSCVAVDSLDSSYIIDALTNIGFYDSDPFTFMSQWHSPGHPMSPADFEELEEKYGEQAIWSKDERRILYDLINSGLVEIFKVFRDPCPWVKQSFCPSILNGNGDIDNLEEKLLKWLQVQITQENDGTVTEKMGAKELEWYDSAHFIDQVGSEIEDLLTEELMAEIFNI